MTTTKTRQQLHSEHLEQVRSVQRRSYFERVRRVMTEVEMMGDPQGCLPGLRQIHDALRREMREHGQTD